MLFSSLLCVAGALSSAYGLPKNVRSTYAVKERHIVPRSWKKVGEAPKADSIHLAIGLKQSNEGVVEQHLLEVSNPDHHRYGKHLTHAEIEDITRPSEETHSAVETWLAEHGLKGAYNPGKDFVHLVIPIEKAEQLLQTTYSTFEHEDGTRISRTPEWSLPKYLHEHIDVVQPTTSFFRPKPKHVSGPEIDETVYSWDWWNSQGKAEIENGGAGPIGKVCNISFTTADCIRTLYGTYDYQIQSKTTSIGHTNYLNQTSKRSDILKYLQTFRPEAAKAADTFKIVNIANANDDQGPYTPAQIASGKNQEAVLDSENILSVVYPQQLTVWQTGGSPPFTPDVNTPTDTNEPYLTWLDYVLGQPFLPQVISTSYGDDEQTVPESYARRACAGFAALGARGISVFFSSGDAGVGGDNTCFSNDGKNKTQFLPAFPAGCPWVTAVGGTQGSGPDFLPEVAVTRFASGAGFSNYFSQPIYQSSAVNNYVKGLNGLHDGLYNKKGRAYPDVAAQGNHDAIVWNGTIRTIGGTSASSPTFAAVISLVNDALVAKGRPTLGFLNPWLYSRGYKALTDVVTGSSYGCNTDGFPAKEGWDAVTGFGTPNFKKLVDAALG